MAGQAPVLDLPDIQGIVLFAYASLVHAAYVHVTFPESAGARPNAWLAKLAKDVCGSDVKTGKHGDKINVGNTHSPRAQADDVGGLVGVHVSYVVDVDFDGFVQLVDGVGGVDVNVPVRMKDDNSGADFVPGKIHMVGDQALRFSRDRHSFPDSDITYAPGAFVHSGVLPLPLSRMTNPRTGEPGVGHGVC